MTRLQHDCAWEGAAAVLAIVAPCLREEEQREAFNEIFEAIAACVQRYHELLRREDKRLLRPTPN